jgi:hypothetical protein
MRIQPRSPADERTSRVCVCKPTGTVTLPGEVDEVRLIKPGKKFELQNSILGDFG